MRYELRRRLATVARSLRELGDDNARALERRIHDGSAEEWLHGEHGSHVWIEAGAALGALRRIAHHLPMPLAAAAVHGERAWGEADALLSGRTSEAA